MLCRHGYEVDGVNGWCYDCMTSPEQKVKDLEWQLERARKNAEPKPAEADEV